MRRAWSQLDLVDKATLLVSCGLGLLIILSFVLSWPDVVRAITVLVMVQLSVTVARKSGDLFLPFVVAALSLGLLAFLNIALSGPSWLYPASMIVLGFTVIASLRRRET